MLVRGDYIEEDGDRDYRCIFHCAGAGILNWIGIIVVPSRVNTEIFFHTRCGGYLGCVNVLIC